MKKNTSVKWVDIFDSYVLGKPGAKCQLPPDLDLPDATVPPPSEAVYIVDQAENEEIDKNVLKRKRDSDYQPPPPRRRTVIMDDVSLGYEIDESMPVRGFEFTSKEEDNARFLRKLAKISMVSEVHGNMLPSQIQVLQYIDSLATGTAPEWRQTALRALAETSQRYPAQPALSREYLVNYLRQARDKERECVNPGCISAQMGGFRCRELVLPGQLHPATQGFCYLCHLYESNRLYWENRNPVSDKTQVYCVHMFSVFTDKLGEYRLDKTIRGDDDTPGLFGPVPIFNVNNYVKIRVSGGKQGWKEHDSLVFRLPSKVSAQSASSPTTRLGTESC